MAEEIPRATIDTLARTIFKEASSYGFRQVDVIRLINSLMDLCTADRTEPASSQSASIQAGIGADSAADFPLQGDRICVRQFDPSTDVELLERWLPDKHGRYFLLSCSTAQPITIEALTSGVGNHLGIITLRDGRPIGAVAYLDHSRQQKRAELRKLIGELDARGQGLAEEAARLWVDYGVRGLGLQKIYLSTLQTQIANIKLNENLGFRVEGLLRNEVLIDGTRHDVLRMGYCVD
jgi:RimJ/RimL family protein N-acetyltransferase